MSEVTYKKKMESRFSLKTVNVSESGLRDAVCSDCDALERARIMLEVPGFASVLLDTSAIILDLSDTMVARLGKSRDEIIGTSALEYFNEKVGQPRQNFFEQAVKTGEVQSFEDYREGYWYSGVINPIKNQDGEVVMVSVLSRDITENMHQRLDVERRELNLKKLIESMPALIVAFNSVGNCSFWNKECEKCLGYSTWEIKSLENPIRQISTAKKYVDNILSKWQENDFDQVNHNIELKARDGELKVIRWTNITHFIQLEGDNIWVLGVDITDQIKAEKTLHHAMRNVISDRELLQEKNIALLEMSQKLNEEKERLALLLSSNVEAYILPMFERLKMRIGQSEEDYIRLISESLKSILSDLGQNSRSQYHSLTTREIEICQMVKGGYSSKEIGSFLNCAESTIRKHRRNIRKKLGINGKKTNLASYLKLY